MKIFRLAAFLWLTSVAFPQTPAFPGRVATNTDLTDLADRAQTTLNGSALNSSATSFTVVSASKFTAGMILTIDDEQIKVCSVVSNTVNVGHASCPNVDGRGFGGTAAAAHAVGKLVSDYFVSYQFKALREEVRSIEGHSSPVLNADWCAVKGDGVTDDAAGINACIATLVSGGTLVFRANSTYIVGSELNATVPNLRIQGGGWGTVLKAKAGSHLDHVLIARNTATGFSIRDLTVDQNKANGGGSASTHMSDSCLLINGAESEIAHVQVQNCSTGGIFIGDADIDARHVTVQNSYVHDIGGITNALGIAVGIAAGGDTPPSGGVVKNNRVENISNTVTTVGATGGIYMQTAPGWTVDGNLVQNAYNILGGSIIFGQCLGAANTGITVVNNTVTRTAAYLDDTTTGIEICGSKALVANNNITGFAFAGIVSDSGSSDVTLANNVITCGAACGSGTATGYPIGTGIISGGSTRLKVFGNLISTLNGYTPNAGDVAASFTQNDLCGSTAKITIASMGIGTTVSGNLCTGVAATDTVPVTATSAAGFTALKTITIPANYFWTGRSVRITLSGLYNSASGAGDYLTWEWGGDLGAFDFRDVNTPGSTGYVNAPWTATFIISCSGVGAGGSVKYSDLNFIPFQIMNANTHNGSYAYDTTVSHTIYGAAKWNAAGAGNSITVLQMTVEDL